MTTVAIIGGGFTGAAIAYHLAQARVAAEIIVFEPRSLLGAGLAYGGQDPTHRINVPETRMSLFPEDETHFVRWLEKSLALASDPQAMSGGQAYPRRQDFGRYVDETLRPLVAERRVRHVQQPVVSLARAAAGWRIFTRGGEARQADFVVIATTHPAPSLPRELLDLSGDPRLIANGLADDALDGIARDARLLIVGSGLTAAEKRRLVGFLAPYQTGVRGSAEPSRWSAGKELEWIELRPELVVEIDFDHVSAGRIRHGAKLRRWREDKDPRECLFEQLG